MMNLFNSNRSNLIILDHTPRKVQENQKTLDYKLDNKWKLKSIGCENLFAYASSRIASEGEFSKIETDVNSCVVCIQQEQLDRLTLIAVGGEDTSLKSVQEILRQHQYKSRE